MKKILGKIMSGNKQQGIALLFALAILSLLMVMAMGFAVSSIFEQKAATNSANTSSARFLAQSVLNRVLVLVNMYGDIVQSSHETSGDKDMLDHLSMDVAGAPLYTWTTSDEVTWEYLTMNDGTSTRLLGRFAYKVIPVAGLDPGALVRDNVNEAVVAGSEQRAGMYTDEINLKSISTTDIVATSPTSTQVSAQKFNYTTYTTAPGAYTGPASGWQSFQNLFEKTGITDEALQSKMLRWFVLDTGRFKSKEAYQVNTTPDPTLYHRFNLARNWAADFGVAYPPVDMYNKILLDSNGDGVPDFNPASPPTGMLYSNTVASADGYGIPWLAYFGYRADGTLDTTHGGTFGNSAAGVINRRRQIAANLVDYCRLDNDLPMILPTSDVNPANWGTSTPAFTGNKKTPYINEVGIHVMFEASQVIKNDTNNKNGKGKGKGKGKKNNGSTTIIDLNVDMDATAELVDIFGLTNLPDSTVKVYYNLSYTLTGTGAPSGAISSSGVLDFTITNGNWGTPKKRYAAPGNWDTGFFTDNPIDDVSIGQNVGFNVWFNMTVQMKAVLNFNGRNYDCAVITATSNPVNITIPAGKTDIINYDYYISCQALDPRQNLNSGDWTVTSSGDTNWNLAEYSTIGGGSLLAKNNNIGTSANGLDVETNFTPSPVAGASTAYIRQGPMLSPWELGCINRGKAWETINLKAFDPTKEFTFVTTGNIIPGGGAYASGDANILNQIKMENSIDNFKININAENIDPATGKNVVLQALLKNIPIGSSWATPGTGGTQIATPPAALITAISSRTYQSRAAVAALAALYDGSCGSGITQDTDAKKEELIGKFINLTDIGGKYYYVIVLAQSIKDVGTPPGAANGITIKKKDKSGNAVTFTNTRLGTFEHPVESPSGSGNYVYADEIVAEQKIKVLMYEPLSGNPIIVSYEFVE